MPDVVISLNDLSTIDDALKALRLIEDSLNKKLEELVKRLGELGVEVAKAGFTSAAYSMGPNDISVDLDTDGKKCTISASGTAVCFIEFGTGVGATHPYGAEKGYTPGSWSQGPHGKGYFPPGWSHNGKYTTGEPAAMAMYDAAKQMREQIQTIAREVFK